MDFCMSGRPQRLRAAGQREPVPNHGWAAVTLILLIAAALSAGFILRHSKLVRRDPLTAVAVAATVAGLDLEDAPVHSGPGRNRPHYPNRSAVSPPLTSLSG